MHAHSRYAILIKSIEEVRFLEYAEYVDSKDLKLEHAYLICSCMYIYFVVFKVDKHSSL